MNLDFFMMLHRWKIPLKWNNCGKVELNVWSKEVIVNLVSHFVSAGVSVWLYVWLMDLYEKRKGGK